jgi:hypothetical protein
MAQTGNLDFPTLEFVDKFAFTLDRHLLLVVFY